MKHFAGAMISRRSYGQDAREWNQKPSFTVTVVVIVVTVDIVMFEVVDHIIRV